MRRRYDRELAARVSAGDEVAIDEFVDRMRCLQRFVPRLESRLGQSLVEAEREDLLQDILLVVWRRLTDFRGDSMLETWVYRICELQLRNALRRSRAYVHASLDAILLLQESPRSKHEGGELEHWLVVLGPREADIVRRKHVDDASFATIAAALDEPVGTVKTRYYRARSKLRRHLSGWLR